jgi:hypothetical protein
VNAMTTSLPADRCSGIVVDGAHQAMAVSDVQGSTSHQAPAKRLYIASASMKREAGGGGTSTTADWRTDDVQFISIRAIFLEDVAISPHRLPRSWQPSEMQTRYKPFLHLCAMWNVRNMMHRDQACSPTTDYEYKRRTPSHRSRV